MPTQGQSQRSSGPSRDVWIVWVQHSFNSFFLALFVLLSVDPKTQQHTLAEAHIGRISFPRQEKAR